MPAAFYRKRGIDLDKKIKVAAVGDNCIDAYDNTGQSFPGGNPVNVAVYIKRLGGEASYTGESRSKHRLTYHYNREVPYG